MDGEQNQESQFMDEEQRILEATETVRSAFSPNSSDVTGTRSAERAVGLARYLGKHAPEAKDGTSKVATREVMEAVEDLLPMLLKPFLQSDDVARFEATGPEDEDAANQDADYVRHVFHTECNAFLTLYTAAKDGLVSRKGIAHIDIAEEEKVSRRVLTGQTEEQLQVIAGDPRFEVVQGTSNEVFVDDGNGSAVPVTLYDVSVEYREQIKKPVIESIAPELFVIDDDHDSLDPDGARVVGHWFRSTYGDLVEQGIDPEKLQSALDGGESPEFNGAGDEYSIRHGVASSGFNAEQHGDVEADREVWVLRARVRVDYNDTGESRRVDAYIAGGTVLQYEESEFIPYAVWSPFPVTHRAEGQSVDDLLGEIADVSTQLTRQLLNNVQQVNYGRPVINESVHLSDCTARATGPIRVKKMALPSASFMRDAPPVMVGEILSALGRVDTMREGRVGYSRAMAGFNPQMMQQTTADAFARGMEQHNARTELMTRIFGEMFYAKLFSKLHEVIRVNQDMPATVRLRGKWVTVDPREWVERNNVAIAVGLGYGTADEKQKRLGVVMDVQQRLEPTGLVEPKHAHATAIRILENAGFKNHSEFFLSPDEAAQKQQQAQEMAQQQPDPQQIMAQMQMQLMQAQIQTEQAKAAAAGAKLQIEQQAKTRELELKELEIMLKSQAADDKRAQDMVSAASAERAQADQTATEVARIEATITAAETNADAMLKATAMKLQNERLLKLPPEAFSSPEAAAMDALTAELDAAFSEQQAQVDAFQKAALEAFQGLAGRMNKGKRIEMQRDANGDLVGATIDGRAVQFTRDANGDLMGADFTDGIEG